MKCVRFRGIWWRLAMNCRLQPAETCPGENSLSVCDSESFYWEPKYPQTSLLLQNKQTRQLESLKTLNRIVSNQCIFSTIWLLETRPQHAIVCSPLYSDKLICAHLFLIQTFRGFFTMSWINHRGLFLSKTNWPFELN